jgi:hypothetical protein
MVKALRRDPRQVTVVADRRTPIERQVEFLDTYEPPPLLQLERRSAGHPTALCARTVEPARGGLSYFILTAALTAPGPFGVLLAPVLWRPFHPLNCAPFIQAAPAVPACAAQGRVS